MACKTVQDQSIRGNFGFSFNAISYNSVRDVGRIKRLYTGVTLPQCVAGAGSWREQMKVLCMMKIVRMLFSVIEYFIVIVV
jgi:hypothetical protein